MPAVTTNSSTTTRGKHGGAKAAPSHKKQTGSRNRSLVANSTVHKSDGTANNARKDAAATRTNKSDGLRGRRTSRGDRGGSHPMAAPCSQSSEQETAALPKKRPQTRRKKQVAVSSTNCDVPKSCPCPTCQGYTAPSYGCSDPNCICQNSSSEYGCGDPNCACKQVCSDPNCQCHQQCSDEDCICKQTSSCNDPNCDCQKVSSNEGCSDPNCVCNQTCTDPNCDCKRQCSDEDCVCKQTCNDPDCECQQDSDKSSSDNQKLSIEMPD